MRMVRTNRLEDIDDVDQGSDLVQVASELHHEVSVGHGRLYRRAERTTESLENSVCYLTQQRELCVCR